MCILHDVPLSSPSLTSGGSPAMKSRVVEVWHCDGSVMVPSESVILSRFTHTSQRKSA